MTTTYTPTNIKLMRNTLAINGFQSFVRIMKERACCKLPELTQLIVSETGFEFSEVRAWKKHGVDNRSAALALCELAEKYNVYFGLHMLIPTQEVCEAWLTWEQKHPDTVKHAA
ncbi:hypothetical protein [Grimontia marina]|uniref:Uncharacterized protein n=1 Tax=Grimontia marina TaxID=646534 RepID=A0A128EYN2_9GAMM|nr:hypothetical protein [Grimontia marina]CZF79678.1 hypothetical protein GMA8713_01079 [Grimontia marina]